MPDLLKNAGPLDSARDPADVVAVLGRIEDCVRDISRGVRAMGRPLRPGPGLYFVVERDSVAGFTDPMGTNRWPVEGCASVFDETSALLETARGVAFSCDGAIVVRNDGTIPKEMVGVNELSTAELAQIDDLPYAGGMSARHMGTLETATRGEVVAAITLSEEDGRVTMGDERRIGD